MVALIRFVILFSFSLFATGVISQDIGFKMKNFPGKEDMFQRATEWLEEGDVAFLNGMAFCRYNLDDMYCVRSVKYYKEALNHYLKAQAFNPNNAKLNFRLGICFHVADNKYAALQYFETAYSLNPSVDSLVTFYLARSFHLASKWDEALKFYYVFKQKINQRPDKYKVKVSDIDRFIKNCEDGKSLEAERKKAVVRNMGRTVNTPSYEYNPIVFEDGYIMSYTSRQEVTVNPDYYLDMDDDSIAEVEKTMVTFKKNDTTWGRGMPLLISQNSKKMKQMSILDISSDGLNMLIYKNGDIYESVFSNNNWSEPDFIAGDLNSEFMETSAAYSSDSKTIFFTSNRSGGYGFKDLYTCSLDSSRVCVKAKNLGNIINTPEDEDGIFVSDDARTLFFSSKGHNSMGGYDVFYSRLDDSSRWQQPVNMAKPINSPGDDIFLVFNDEFSGFLSSCRADCKGNIDVYEFALDKPIFGDTLVDAIANTRSNADTLSSQRVAFCVKTFDAVDSKPLESRVFARSSDGLDFVDSSSSGNGTVCLQLLPGKDYSIIVRSQDYCSKSVKIHLADSGNPGVLFVYLPPKQKLHVIYSNDAVDQDSLTAVSYIDGEVSDFFTNKNVKALVRVTDERLKTLIAETQTDAVGKYRIRIHAGKTYLVETESTGYVFQNQLLTVPDGLFEVEFKCKGIKNESLMVKQLIPDSMKSSVYMSPLCEVEADILIDNPQRTTCELRIVSADPNQYFNECLSWVSKGKYKTVLPVGKRYEMKVFADGYEYVFDNKMLAIPADARKVHITSVLPTPPPPFHELSSELVHFASNMVSCQDSALRKICTFISASPQQQLELIISGHTDDVGSQQFNQILSERRAEFVKEKIRRCSAGAATTIHTKGEGEMRPLLVNSSDDNRAVNRRAEIKIVKKIE